MARRNQQFLTIRTEGGLLPSEFLRRALDPRAQLKGIDSASYGLAASERITEAITQSWVRLQKHWIEFRVSRQRISDKDAGTGITNEKWSLPLLRELAFGVLPASNSPTIDGHTYAINRFLGPIPIHLVGCRLSLDKRAEGVRGAARSNPHGLVQEFLNRSPGHTWGIVSNGLKLRVLRDNASLSRQAYLEFDLEAMFEGEVYSDFVLLWLFVHATRFQPRDGQRSDTCWLEEWAKAAHAHGIRALDDLRGGVEQALQILGKGFVSHPKNAVLRENLRTGKLPLSSFHNQLLRTIYRLIFLFVAEDRELEGQPLLFAPDTSPEAQAAKERYTAYYSTRRLRQLAFSIRGSRHGDLWHQLQTTIGALAGHPRFEGARNNLSLPILGSALWSISETPDLNGPSIEQHGTQLANDDLLEAVRHLAYTRQDHALIPIDYKDLGPEELGSVYEGLFSLTPQIRGDGADFYFAEFAGNQRKVSGSYYTSDSLVQSLLDSALEPVIAAKIKNKRGLEAERALLSLKVCDPSVGSGHFLLGAAHRLARHLARIRSFSAGESEPGADRYQHALRDVIGHCLYGVDSNPMAVELCKFTLWLEALEPGKPLSLLDRHIRQGNSLIGATPELIARGIPSTAFDLVEGDDRKACSAVKKQNESFRDGQKELFNSQVAEASPGYRTLQDKIAEIDAIDDGSVTGILEKQAQLARLDTSDDYKHAQLVADAWCAAFFLRPGQQGSPTITEQVFTDLRDHRRCPEWLPAAVQKCAQSFGFLHWHLAFPEVAANGGFDVILGNPPWEKLQIEEEKFFAVLAPEIAQAPARSRKAAIKKLSEERPEIFQKYVAAQRDLALQVHFIKNSEKYPLCGGGNVSTHSLFLELATTLISNVARAGLVLPSGLATQESQGKMFSSLTSTGRLKQLLDFENRKALFQDVDSRFRFCLVTIGAPEVGAKINFAFFLQATEDVLEPGRSFTLDHADLEAFSPNTKSCPQLSSAKEASLLRAIYGAGTIILNEQTGENAWGWRSWQMFNETHEAALLNDTQSEADLPLYEAKLFHQFDHRYSTYDSTGSTRSVEPFEKAEPTHLAKTRYWVPSRLWNDRVSTDGYSSKWLLAFRRITNATNERTSIFSVLPQCITGSQAPAVKTTRGARPTAALLANLNSFAFDFATRKRVGGTDLNHFIVHQLPVLHPDVLSKPEIEGFILPRVLELTYTSIDLANFAKDCGWSGKPFRWDEDRRFALKCELDAMFFFLYLGSPTHWASQASELTADFKSPSEAIDYIMESFPIVKRREVERFGSFRSKVQILHDFKSIPELLLKKAPSAGK